MIGVSTPRFPLGKVAATSGAVEALRRAGQSLWAFLTRHVAGDWGECDTHDRQSNERAVVQGHRILSAYRISTGERIWVITEADPILLPDEY